MKAGASLVAYDGFLYAFRGDNQTTFYRYNIATPGWVTLAAAPATVAAGGDLVFQPTGDVSLTRASASKSLVTGVSTVVLRMTVTSEDAIDDILANPPSFTATGGATASFSAATLVSPDNDISGVGDPVIYEWVVTVTPGATPGEITFSVSNSLGAASTATSNSVLVTPILTYEVEVDDPAPDIIYNTALLDEAGDTLANVPSNRTETALSGSIGDRVWVDLNGDGLQDPGEPGLVGVEVCVYDLDDNLMGCDITDAFGNYRVYGLPAGDYVVRINPTTYPAGYQLTTDASFNVSLTENQQYDAADFGLLPPTEPGEGRIGNTIWLDSDNDGVQDDGEAGLPGIVVNLEINVDGIWYPVATTVTDANGNYEFTGLFAGDYRVTVDPNSQVTSPYAAGTFNLGDVMAPTYDLDGGLLTPNGVTLVTLAANNSVVTDADFGYNWSGSIGDYVWWDDNINGLQDEDPDRGIFDARVQLYFDANGDGLFNPVDGDFEILRVFTDVDGYYFIPNLPPGNYIVDVYEDSLVEDGVRNVVPTTADLLPVTLAPGNMNVDTADFGYFIGARVEALIFWDQNHNGVFDGNEQRLAGIEVTLTGTDLQGNPVTATAVSGPDGTVIFLVPEGNYTISYNPPDVAAEYEGLGTTTTPTSFTFFAQAGEDGMETQRFQFGVDNTGAIGDRVWNDADGDGTQDAGELGIPGVTVELYDGEGNFLAATVTDNNGYYLFPGLDDGDYVVRVRASTVPAGFVNTYDEDDGATNPDGETAVTISNGFQHLTADFGYYNNATYTVSGTIWNDLDGQGDFNETVYLAGVTVCLLNQFDAVVACTVTDADGDYAFPGIPNGSYTIEVNPSTLPNGAYVPTSDPDGHVITPHTTAVVVNNGNVTNQNFGYQEQLGSISGTICEGNGNGLCDDGETVMEGVTVFLTWAGPDGILGNDDDVVYIAITDGDGNYTFPNLLPGQYQITKIDPNGYDSLADADGGAPNNISVNLGVGQNKIDQDFELQQALGVIGNRVWLDVDGDGVQDIGEPGLANVTVYLCADAPCTADNAIATTTTDANGNYLFTDVPPGTYYVGVDATTLPDGLDASPGSFDNLTAIVLDPGESYLNADFGYMPTAGTAVIGDFIWADADGDGIQDPGEIGIAGVTVTLKDSDGNSVATTVTGPDGRYYFTDVLPGSYTVEVTPPAGYTVTSGPESEGADISRTIVVNAGDVVTNVDFGYDSPDLFTISNRVWYDIDGDNAVDPGEYGIGGVTVNLLDADGNIIATVVTNPDGTFSFSGVPNGAYTIQIGDANNLLGDYQGTSPVAFAGELAVLVAGADVSGVNFGYNQPGAIGDTIWSDANGDGVQDPGELGIAGVTVELFYDADGDGQFDANVDTLIATAVTDAGGNYLFTGLPAGDYFVVVTPPVGYTQTGDPDGMMDSLTAVSLTPAAASFLNADFGYQSDEDLPDISGSVWNDLNWNGANDGEPPLAGVTVALLDANGNVVATTVTDVSGNYTFFDVPPGDYTVAVTDLHNVLDGYQLTSGLDTIPVTVGAVDITGVDFGYVHTPETAVIGDRIWFDADGDGVQDASETGLANVTVNLYDADDNLIATTTTDLNGNYLFTGLPAGSYYVAVNPATLPNGGVGLSETTGGNDNRTPIINLSQGQIYLDADLGYTSTSGSALGDRIWYDFDGDGLQDPGEIGIPGVTVNVYDSNGDLKWPPLSPALMVTGWSLA
jgi:protocatechuate 3,4-dioxygenase beta subunit